MSEPEPDAPPEPTGAEAEEPSTSASGSFLIPEPEDAIPETPPPAEPPAPAEPPWYLAMRAKLAGMLASKGFGPVGISGFALAPAAIGALALATNHPGIGGIFGAAAAILVWLALAPDAQGRPPAFAALTAHALVPLWLGGMLVAASTDAEKALSAWVSFVLLLLPLARAQGGPGRLTDGPLLWSWGERTTALVLGAFLARGGLAMFVTACIATADLILRLVILHPPVAGGSRLPPGLSKLFGPDGTPQAGVRLAFQLGLALLAVVLIALGTADDWRF